MARKSKNKASKCWISKAVNNIQGKLQEGKDWIAKAVNNIQGKLQEGKDWIAKAVNSIQGKFQEGKKWISTAINQIKSVSQEEKEFLSPVAIALGLAAWSISSIIIFTPPINGWIAGLVWLTWGLGFIVIGCLIRPDKNRKLWLSRTLIVAGIPICSLGGRIASSCPIWAWIIIAVAVICIVSGLYIMCSVYKKRQQG